MGLELELELELEMEMEMEMVPHDSPQGQRRDR
jgi:hypothetical protein